MTGSCKKELKICTIIVGKVKTLWESRKIWKNSPPVLTKQLFLLSSVKTRGRFFQIFVDFSEKLNFTLKFLRSSVTSIARCLLTTGLIGITDPANWLAFLMSSSVASPFLGFFEFTGNKINLDWYSFNLNFDKKNSWNNTDNLHRI